MVSASRKLDSKGHMMKKVSRYRNVKVTIDGNKFDSKKEGKRYQELKLMARAGVITALELQPKYELVPTLRLITETLCRRSYIADFRYKDNYGDTIVEDVKSPITKKDPTYRLKRHLFLAKYGDEMTFREI